jgi:glutathione peroxidase
MKKIILFSLILINQFMYGQNNKTFHDFTVKSIDGKMFDLSQLKGKKVLVVNTASRCGFTPQYADLEKLYKKYKDHNFMIIGFPANNFLRQEPGTDAEIMNFCQLNYGVTFPMMSKISVRGKDIHPIYSWLTSKKQNGVMDSRVKWNFQKYMIDEDGKLAGMVSSKTNPFSEKIISWIESK